MLCRCELSVHCQLQVCTWSGVAVLALYWCDLPYQVRRQWWSLIWRKCSRAREWWPKSAHGLRWEVSVVVSQCPIPSLSNPHSIPCPPVCSGCMGLLPPVYSRRGHSLIRGRSTGFCFCVIFMSCTEWWLHNHQTSGVPIGISTQTTTVISQFVDEHQSCWLWFLRVSHCTFTMYYFVSAVSTRWLLNVRALVGIVLAQTKTAEST